MSSHQPIHELLHQHGLRSSLLRLKVIDALYAAAKLGKPVGTHALHAQLDIPLVSVRGALRRLKKVGIVSYHSGWTYSLTAEARNFLEQ
ncbi:fe2+ zn2+ uptake regulation protein [Pseudomonas putida]